MNDDHLVQFVAISVTSLIIFFVLVHHPNYSVMASLLSDISHSVLLVLSSVAILVGFIKTSKLKFQPGMLRMVSSMNILHLLTLNYVNLFFPSSILTTTIQN